MVNRNRSNNYSISFTIVIATSVPTSVFLRNQKVRGNINPSQNFMHIVWAKHVRMLCELQKG